MKKIFNKNIVVFFCFISIQLFPQNEINDQFIFAKKIFDGENYFDAITEFKRLLFFDIENQYEYDANKLIGLSYKAGGKYDEAIRYFTLAEISAKTSEEIYAVKAENVRTNILRRTTSRAFDLLTQLEEKFPQKISEINYWRGWTYIFSDEWDKAAEVFKEINEKKLADFCLNVDDEKYSVNLARVLSVFIPGAGQFYTGNYLSGTISLGWNILFGYLAVDAFIEERIFDGLLIGNLLWLRFYNGSIQNAVKFAEEKNLRIINKYFNELEKMDGIIKP